MNATNAVVRRVGLRRMVMVVLLGVGAWHLAEAARIHAKAWLAQRLIERSWELSQQTGAPIRPWDWADTYPVARIAVPRLAIERFVLSGDSGRTLAFGPGHRHGTPLPGQSGNSIVSAHRDTHFAFLRELAIGDELLVEGRDGNQSVYRVERTMVIGKNGADIDRSADGVRLTLVTCYPFDGVATGTSLRYVVETRSVEPSRRVAMVSPPSW